MKVLRYVITVILLGVVVWQSGLLHAEGRQQFLSIIQGASLGWLVLSFITPVLMDWVCALKWYFLAKTIDVPSRPGQLFAYYLMGRFFNLVLPSNIGGDIVRVHLHGKGSNRLADAAAAVFMERFTGLITLLVVALCVGWYQSKVLNVPFLELALGVSILGTIFLAWLLFDDRPFALCERLAVRIWAKSAVIFKKIQKFRSGVARYREKPGALLASLLWSIAFYGAAIVYIWVSAMAFDEEVTLEVMIVAVPLIMVLMNLPISVGGIGLMEFAYTMVLGAMGVPAEVGLATALLVRIHTFYLAGIGGVLYGIRHDKAAEELLEGQVPEAVAPAEKSSS